jgi:hypothetical protein
MVNLSLIGFNIIIGILIFVSTKVVLDLFGQQIKDKVKVLLPKGTTTDEGEIIG